MHIYVERMYALIHTCRVLHNKAFSKKKKTPTILLKGIKVFNDKIARKSPLVILIGWSLNIARYLESQDRKGIQNRKVRHGK